MVSTDPRCPRCCGKWWNDSQAIPNTCWSSEVVYFDDEQKIFVIQFAMWAFLHNKVRLLSAAQKFVGVDQMDIIHIKDQCIYVTNDYIFSSIRLLQQLTDLSSACNIGWMVDVMIQRFWARVGEMTYFLNTYLLMKSDTVCIKTQCTFSARYCSVPFSKCLFHCKGGVPHLNERNKR